MKPTESEQIQTNRANILSDLQLFASRDEQMAYPVLVEYFCLWGDDHYHPSDKLFRKAYTQTEAELLAEFDRCLERARQRIGHLPSTPQELWKYPEWQAVMEMASNVLKEWKQ